ncbi:hypothetical protein L7F22_007382 [Adiantum nelumboides]|nr:hypothetical protein [Adiantum nelumboides]
MDLRKAVEDLYSNAWILSHFSPNCQHDTDYEPLLQAAALSSPDSEMFAMSLHSSIVPRKGTSLCENPASFSEGVFPKEVKKIGYSQTSLNTFTEVGGFNPSRASSRRSSANPLFRASRSLRRLTSPEFHTTNSRLYGVSDLENGYSPCLSSTEMSVYGQQSTDPFLTPEAINADSTVNPECQANLYSSTSYATPSLNCDDYARDMDFSRYNAGDTYPNILQDNMMDENELTAHSSLQPLSKGLRESVINLEPQPGEATDENMEHKDTRDVIDSFILKEEVERASVDMPLLPKLEPKAPSIREAMDSAMMGDPGLDLPSGRSDSCQSVADLYPASQILDDSKMEEQGLKMLTEIQERLHGEQLSSTKDEENTRYSGIEEGTESYSMDTPGMQLKEEGSSGEKLYQPEGDSSSYGESMHLSDLFPGSYDKNQDRIEGHDVVARGAQDYTPGKAASGKLGESTANTSDASIETSATSRSESSGQSTPRSLATASISEQAESLNSKASTLTDVSDDESSDNSVRSELQGESAQHNRGIPTLLGPQRITRTASYITDWHNSPSAMEDSPQRPSQRHPTSSANESQSIDSFQGLALPGSYSTSQPQASVGSRQFSISRLPIAEMQASDFRRSVLEDGILSQDSSMASRSISRIPQGRARWDYGGENIPREPS